jgi:hypothetical protein
MDFYFPFALPPRKIGCDGGEYQVVKSSLRIHVQFFIEAGIVGKHSLQDDLSFGLKNIGLPEFSDDLFYDVLLLTHTALTLFLWFIFVRYTMDRFEGVRSTENSGISFSTERCSIHSQKQKSSSRVGGYTTTPSDHTVHLEEGLPLQKHIW